MFGINAPETPAEVTAESARAYFTDNAAGLRTFGFLMAASAVLLIVVLSQLIAARVPLEIHTRSGIWPPPSEMRPPYPGNGVDQR